MFDIASSKVLTYKQKTDSKKLEKQMFNILFKKNLLLA